VSATPDMIKDAFRKMSKKYHPDRNPSAKDKFQKINVGKVFDRRSIRSADG